MNYTFNWRLTIIRFMYHDVTYWNIYNELLTSRINNSITQKKYIFLSISFHSQVKLGFLFWSSNWAALASEFLPHRNILSFPINFNLIIRQKFNGEPPSNYENPRGSGLHSSLFTKFCQEWRPDSLVSFSISSSMMTVWLINRSIQRSIQP